MEARQVNLKDNLMVVRWVDSLASSFAFAAWKADDDGDDHRLQSGTYR